MCLLIGIGNAGNKFHVWKAVLIFSVNNCVYTCAGGKYAHLIGSWASREDNSYNGSSASSCNMLEDAEDVSEG